MVIMRFQPKATTIHVHRGFRLKNGSTDLEGGAGALNLDVTPAGRVPATDRQVAGQVLVSNCLAVDGSHLGLYQMTNKKKKFCIVCLSWFSPCV